MLVVVTVAQATYEVHLNCWLYCTLFICDYLWESYYIHGNWRIIIIQQNILKYNREEGLAGSWGVTLWHKVLTISSFKDGDQAVSPVSVYFRSNSLHFHSILCQPSSSSTF
jgi:hypothetical protein